MPDHEQRESGSQESTAGYGHCDVLQSAVPAALTLEQIIDLTGELEHLNELVLIHLEKNGGFKGQQSYFTIVTPVLDNLEIVIRQKYLPGMSRNEIKLVIQDWIDGEIAGFR